MARLNEIEYKLNGEKKITTISKFVNYDVFEQGVQIAVNLCFDDDHRYIPAMHDVARFTSALHMFTDIDVSNFDFNYISELLWGTDLLEQMYGKISSQLSAYYYAFEEKLKMSRYGESISFGLMNLLEDSEKLNMITNNLTNFAKAYGATLPPIDK